MKMLIEQDECSIGMVSSFFFFFPLFFGAWRYRYSKLSSRALTFFSIMDSPSAFIDSFLHIR